MFSVLQVDTQSRAVPPAEGGGEGAFCFSGDGGTESLETAALGEPLDTTGVAEIENTSKSPYYAELSDSDISRFIPLGLRSIQDAAGAWLTCKHCRNSKKKTVKFQSGGDVQVHFAKHAAAVVVPSTEPAGIWLEPSSGAAQGTAQAASAPELPEPSSRAAQGTAQAASAPELPEPSSTAAQGTAQAASAPAASAQGTAKAERRELQPPPGESPEEDVREEAGKLGFENCGCR